MKHRRFKRCGIIRAFGQWAVTQFGVENLRGPCNYDIGKAAVGHPWWSDHMADKNWVNKADFGAALSFARRHFGITVAEDFCDKQRGKSRRLAVGLPAPEYSFTEQPDERLPQSAEMFGLFGVE
jgi:hypothetical protein